MSKKKKAKFKCLNKDCLYRWKSETNVAVCPKCKHKYVKCMNFEEMFARQELLCKN